MKSSSQVPVPCTLVRLSDIELPAGLKYPYGSLLLVKSSQPPGDQAGRPEYDLMIPDGLVADGAILQSLHNVSLHDMPIVKVNSPGDPPPILASQLPLCLVEKHSRGGSSGTFRLKMYLIRSSSHSWIFFVGSLDGHPTPS